VPINADPGAWASAEAGDRNNAEQRFDTTITPNAATRAVWGEPRKQRPRTISLVDWRPYVKGALRGFATVLLPIGLKLVDCPVLASNGKGDRFSDVVIEAIRRLYRGALDGSGS